MIQPTTLLVEHLGYGELRFTCDHCYQGMAWVLGQRKVVQPLPCGDTLRRVVVRGGLLSKRGLTRFA
nr:hypothetical protein [Gammaproteobacteria bacterium]